MTPLAARSQTSGETPVGQKSEKSFFQKWWDQPDGLTAGWFGLAKPMKDIGLTISADLRQVYFGQVAGGLPNQSASNWLNEEKLRLVYDFGPVFKIKGLTIESNWRYRGGNSPQWVAGTPSNFNPTGMSSGMGVRVLPQQIQYTTPNKAITINAGWENPYDQFLQQPLSKFFENNAITTSKGIGGAAGPGIAIVNPASSVNAAGVPTRGSVAYYRTSSVPWTSSYAAWGGTLRVKPSRDFYVQAGLYMSIAGSSGVNPSQYTATSVYPYTSVPQSYLGKFRKSGEVVPVVGADGQIIPGAKQNIGWVPAVSNNHGLTFAGAPAFTPNTTQIGVRPSTPTNSPYVNAKGQRVAAPPYYAASPYDPGNSGNYNQNGLFMVSEVGWTPKFGPDKLEGKYVIGGYIWGQKNSSFTPSQFTASTFPASYTVITGGTKAKPQTTTYPGNDTTPTYTSYAATRPAPTTENQVVWGLYFQADQQLYKVKDTPSTATTPADGLKKAREPFSDKGLYGFSVFTFTPPSNNQLPFYFHIGLVYKGLVPTRDNDSVGVAFASGFYSPAFNKWLDAQNKQLQNAFGSAYNATVPNGPVVQQPVNPGTGTSASIPSSTLNPTKGTYSAPQSTQALYQNYYAYQPLFTSTQVIEAFYNVQLTKWASIKPYTQFIINPAGNGTVKNDWILGVSARLAF